MNQYQIFEGYINNHIGTAFCITSSAISAIKVWQLWLTETLGKEIAIEVVSSCFEIEKKKKWLQVCVFWACHDRASLPPQMYSIALLRLEEFKELLGIWQVCL